MKVSNATPIINNDTADQVLLPWEEQFQIVVQLAADTYWEQDENCRLTKLAGPALAEKNIDSSQLLGKTPWEMHRIVVDDDWPHYQQMFNRHEPFRDYIFKHVDARGELVYSSNSGQPVFDAQGQYRGYRGITKDITKAVRAEQLLRLEHCVTRCLADADSAEAGLQAVMSAIGETEGWQCGSFWRVDKTANLLRFAHSWTALSVSAVVAESFGNACDVVIEPGCSVLGRAWQSGQPQWVADVGAQRAMAEYSLELHANFVFPVAAAGEVIGIFDFYSSRVRQPDERLLAAINVIGSQIGQFLQRKQIEREMRDSEERFRSLTEFSSDWYWEQDAQLRFVSIAGRGIDASLASYQKCLGKHHWDPHFHTEPVGATWAEHQAQLRAREPFRDFILKCQTCDGGTLYFSNCGRPFYDEHGVFKGYRGVGRDITEQKLAEQRIQYLATHDALTALPNRSMFNEMLAFAINYAQRYQHPFAVLFIDLDGFKTINDTLGHAAGDKVLCEVSRRLTGTLRTSDVISRLGGDEFVVLIQKIDSPVQIKAVVHKLLAALRAPIQLVDQECHISASIGVSRFPADTGDAQTLIKNADQAMYRAKQAGKNNYQIYLADVVAPQNERVAAMRRRSNA